MIFILLCTLFALSQITETVSSPIRISKNVFFAKRLSFDNEVMVEDSAENNEAIITTLIENSDSVVATAPEKPSWANFLKEIGLAASLGCTIGALSGSLCQTLEAKKNIHWLGCWVLSAVMRVTLLNAIMPSFKENNIPHNPKAIGTIAWATDWIVYIYKKNFLATLLN